MSFTAVVVSTTSVAEVSTTSVAEVSTNTSPSALVIGVSSSFITSSVSVTEPVPVVSLIPTSNSGFSLVPGSPEGFVASTASAAACAAASLRASFCAARASASFCAARASASFCAARASAAEVSTNTSPSALVIGSSAAFTTSWVVDTESTPDGSLTPISLSPGSLPDGNIPPPTASFTAAVTGSVCVSGNGYFSGSL